MPSSQEKVVDYLISRLRDKDPGVRRRTISELEALGAAAEAALPALRNCYETADEKEIRAAAKEAGLKIYMAAHPPKNDDA